MGQRYMILIAFDPKLKYVVNCLSKLQLHVKRLTKDVMIDHLKAIFRSGKTILKEMVIPI
ncbi:hypothetical protein RD00_23425 [Pseudomonas amygdali pv. tabaci]|nr:hypothetical protein RD00_23425 [Pseudomonas amygdali pv. tabaci]